MKHPYQRISYIFLLLSPLFSIMFFFSFSILPHVLLLIPYSSSCSSSHSAFFLMFFFSFSILPHVLLLIQTWVGPFVMAAVMANCIRRSNALNGYSPRLTYRESVVFPNFFAGTAQYGRGQSIIMLLLNFNLGSSLSFHLFSLIHLSFTSYSLSYLSQLS